MNPRTLLAALLRQQNLNPNALARATNYETKQPQIHRFLTGEAKEPKRSTLAPVAKYFDIPIDALFDPRAASAVARERGISEEGEILEAPTTPASPAAATPSPFSDANVAALSVEPRLIPLISWVQAGAWCEAVRPLTDGDALDWLPCPSKHGPNTYALEVVGFSMDGPGGYREGEIIFVDPDAEAMPGKDVIACSPEGDATFKRLKEDVDGLYLLALNPSFPDRIIRMPKGTRLCGVVIGSYLRR